ncbi:uncharacterized protein DMENIID0001_120580 [Sergentomyia squamirostris]
MSDLVENTSPAVLEGYSAEGVDRDWKEQCQKLEQDLQKRCTENEILKARIANLEKEMAEKAGSSKPSKSHKQKDDLLTKAKELLFEKAKICKRQEQQIQALITQIDSIKEVMSVTKEMLEIRNKESEQAQIRYETLEARVKAEKEHHVITLKKLQISKQTYIDLRKEYDLQSGIFKELRENYTNKIKILTAELEKYKPSSSPGDQASNN